MYVCALCGGFVDGRRRKKKKEKKKKKKKNIKRVSKFVVSSMSYLLLLAKVFLCGAMPRVGWMGKMWGWVWLEWADEPESHDKSRERENDNGRLVIGAADNRGNEGRTGNRPYHDI